MVGIKSSKGGIVQVSMLGINEVARRLAKNNQQITRGVDLGVIRAGGFVEEEVKESIAGNRAEQRSVRTGLFGNSIEFEKTGEAQGIVRPSKSTYPGTSTTTEDVAGFMETKRHHFQNTKSRTEPKIDEIIEKAIRNAL